MEFEESELIVPMLCVGMPHWTLCVRFGSDAERHGLHSHAGAWERSELGF